MKCSQGHELHPFVYYDNDESQQEGRRITTTNETKSCCSNETKSCCSNETKSCCYLCKKERLKYTTGSFYVCTGSFYICSSLGINICRRCIPYFQHNCDICKTRIKGSFWGCRRCDIDICKSCNHFSLREDILTLPPNPPGFVNPNDQERDIIMKYYWWTIIQTPIGWTDLVRAPECVRNNKFILMAAIKEHGWALQYATPDLQNDKQVVIASVQQNGTALQFASPNLQNDKQVVLAAVQCPAAKYSRIGKCPLEFASPNLQSDKQVVIAAVKEEGFALKFASPDLQNDREVVQTAIKNNDNYYYGFPSAFQFASPSLRKDKGVVLQAIQQNVDNIKYIESEDLKRDPDVLIAAGMFDKDHDDAAIRRKQQQQKPNTSTIITRKIAFSTRFSLASSSHSRATKFTTLFKDSKYFQKEGNFVIYAPNAFDKKTCDPDWTNFDHPCRGCTDTCQYNNKLTDDETGGHPTDDCCWRYSYRSQLQEAKDSGGFMLQLVETGEYGGMVKDAALGDGQRIELDMAQLIGTKVFQVYCPTSGTYECDFERSHIDVVTAEISRWYNDYHCQDKSVTSIRPSVHTYVGYC